MRYRYDQPSLLVRVGAFAGLAFMHIPVLIIILYAFTTEDRTYQFPPPGLTLKWFAVTWERADVWQEVVEAVVAVKRGQDRVAVHFACPVVVGKLAQGSGRHSASP